MSDQALARLDEGGWPNTVRLAGVEVGFAEFASGRTPAHDLDEAAEATLAPMGSGVRSRLLRLVHAVQTGVQTGVIGREHPRAVAAAVGGSEVVEALHGDEKVNEEVARYLSSAGDIIAAWWVLIHEEPISKDNLLWGQAVDSVSTRHRPENDRRVEALVSSLKVSGMVKG